MLNQLTGLRRLTWGCLQQVPPCVLQALASKPECQLDVPAFSLRSLFRPVGEPLGIDAHELELATSSSLSSLCLRFDFRDEGSSNYNYYAVMDMARGAAPNLRRVALLYETSGSSPASVRTLGLQPQPWRHDLISELPGTSLGKIECLELRVYDTGETLRKWSTVTDFSALRTLKLYSSVDKDTFRWLASDCDLSGLNDLVVMPDEDDDSLLGELYSATQVFLKNVPPLRSLRLSKHFDQATLEVALQTHGQTLQRLLLTGKRKIWLISMDVVEMIQRYCPVLEELYLPVKRSAGNAQEVAIYRALGSMHGIKRLYLTFHQTNVRLPLGYVSQDQANPRDHDVRDALINFAVDEKLASSIFQIMSSSKAPGMRQLEYLELRAEEKLIAGYRGYYNERVFEYLRRSWVCKRIERDDNHTHACTVQELDKEAVLDREYDERAGEYDRRLDEDEERIFRSIWPGDGAWKDEWWSLPLNVTL